MIYIIAEHGLYTYRIINIYDGWGVMAIIMNLGCKITKKSIWIAVLFLAIQMAVPFAQVAAKSHEVSGEQLESSPPESSKILSADHSSFDVLNKDFASGLELTKACLSCHNQSAKQVHTSPHWEWSGLNSKTGQTVGKKNVLNGLLMTISSNEPYCTLCHISNKWTEDTFDNKAEEQVDCLACHDTTGTYALKKMHQLRAKCSACHVDFDKSKARDVVRKPDLTKLAKLVGKSSVQTCGSCHFFSDGGDGVKHGDLDSSLFSATKEVDIHMAKDGEGYDCTTCHKTEKHKMQGSRYMPASKDIRGMDVVGGSRATCESCHGIEPHPETVNDKLNDHVARIACQTCHIPALARGGVPTKTYWDWSTAGRLNDEGKAIIEKDGQDRVTYSSQRGSSQWEENVVPDYIWFNGRIEHLTLTDTIDPSGVVQLNSFAGSSDDPESRIWPVKVLRGKQPFDSENMTLVTAHLFGKEGDAYWKAYNWEESIDTGMKAAGLEFSGKVGFVETEMRIPINHMIAPAKDSLQCESCHSKNGRLADVPGVHMPGRGANPIIDYLGIFLILFSLAGVIGHATLRVVLRHRNNRKA